MLALNPTYSRYVSACLLTAASTGQTNPMGGQVVEGQVDIQYGVTTTINQATDKAIVNWEGFSIDANEHTQFIQPSSTSITLNRVTGGDPSHILGKLSANGTVFLSNPNGIVFGKNAVVDVGGLVATTARITDHDFHNGNYHFDNAPEYSQIINEGHITVHQAGLAALVAPSVINSGIITANLGEVVIGSAKTFTVDFYGDDLISFDASSLVKKGNAENIGVIQANGGKVLMTASATDDVLENLVNMEGYIEANNVSQHNGVVVLQGYGNARVTVAGNIDADHGDVSVRADVVSMSQDAIIHADNGKVTLYGNNELDFQGSIVAHNGFVETSADYSVLISGHVLAGLWYIDPVFDLTVNNALAASIDASLDANTPVLIEADNSIIFNTTTPISWNTAATFSARADADASGAGTITMTAGTVTSSGSGDISFFYNPSSYATPTTFSTVTAPGTSVFYPYMLVNNEANLTTIAASSALWDTEVYALGKDILMSNTNFGMIGTTTALSFKGVFNGNGHTIDNLHVTRTAADAGFFGVVGTNAVIRNIALTNPVISNTAANTGAIIGRITGGTLIGAFSVTGGSVTSTSSVVGGLIGSVSTNAVMGSNFSATNSAIVSGTTTVAGVIGNVANVAMTFAPASLSNSGTVACSAANCAVGGIMTLSKTNLSLATTMTNSGAINHTGGGTSALIGGLLPSLPAGTSLSGTLSNSGTITGSRNVGGLFGSVTGTQGTFTGNWSNTGVISVSSTLGGGIAGTFTASSSANISANMSNTGTVGNTLLNPTSIGGLIGSFSNGTLSGNLSSTASIMGGGNTGGLIGLITNGNITSTNVMGPSSGATIGSVFTATSSAQAATGGFFGQVTGNSTITSNLTNHATVISTRRAVGGIVGLANGNVTLSGVLTNIGSITGNTEVGGIAGQILNGVTLGNISKVMSNSGAITGGNRVGTSSTNGIGGIVGSAAGTTSNTITGSTIQNTGSFTVAASGISGWGGIVGTLTLGSLNASTNIINTSDLLTVTGSAVGGLVGEFTAGSMSTPAFTQSGNISGGSDVGGFIGAVRVGVTALPATAINFSSSSQTITGTGADIGGLFGEFAMTNAYSQNLSFAGLVTGGSASSNVGSVIGLLNGGALSGSLAATQSVVGANDVGGLIGEMANGSISGALNYGDANGTDTVSLLVSGNAGAGFIVGRMSGNSDISSNSITIHSGASFSNITGTNSIGGIVGILLGTSKLSGLSTATITMPTNINVSNVASVGGVVGQLNAATAFNSNLNSLANISGSSNVGGVIGLITGATTVVSGVIYNSHNVTSSGADAGGIAGEVNGATLSGDFDLYSGAISGTTNVGGLFGNVTANAKLLAPIDADATGGSVSGTGANIGGLFGSVASTTAYTATNEFSNNALVFGSTTSSNVGGIFGIITGITVNNALTSTNSVTGANDVGGIAGELASSVLSGALAYGNGADVVSLSVSGNAAAGFIAGRMSGASNISSNSINVNSNASFSNITGTNSIGGIVGLLQGTSTLSGLSTATITMPTNINVSNVTSVGSVIGQLNGATAFNSNLNSLANVSGLTNVGGVIGLITGTTTVVSGAISNSHNVTAAMNDAGGVAGEVNGSTLSGDFDLISGNISGASNVGGVFGLITTNVKLLSSIDVDSAGGSVSGTGANIGGLFGSVASNTTYSAVNAFTSNTTVMGSSTSSNVGGIFGIITGKIVSNALIVNANVSGGTNVGGFVGSMKGAASISQVYNNRALSVTGNMNVGGIAGSVGVGASLNDILFGGTINATGASNVGGIAGLNQGTINRVLSVGSVIGASNVGAIVGNNLGTITASFYDTTVNANGVGSGSALGVTGDNSDVLGNSAIYISEGWNFPTVWSSLNGYYPLLTGCGMSCAVALVPVPPVPPAPQPAPTVPSHLVTAFVQVERTLQADPAIINIPTATYLTTYDSAPLITLSGLMDEIYSSNNIKTVSDSYAHRLVQELNNIVDDLSNIDFIDINNKNPSTVAESNSEDIIPILVALIDYYHHNKTE